MAIKQELSKNEFIREFDEFNRSENFSVKGRSRLYDYLWDLSNDIGEDINTDIIALCCEYNEFKNIDEFITYFGTDEQKKKYKAIEKADKGDLNDLEILEEEFKEEIEKEIRRKTTLLKFSDDLNDGFIIQVY